MALWVRMRGLKQASITSALNDTRTLVKTSCMRQTLHLLPAADFSIYMTALRRSRVEAVHRILSRFGVTTKQIDHVNKAVMDALIDGPLTRRVLITRIKAKAGKNLLAWMDSVWSLPWITNGQHNITLFRQALAEGWICYGPEKTSEVTFTRVDQWLPKQRQVTEEEAKQTVLRGFLSSYGPATVQDFSKWSGIPMKEATPVWKSLDDELMQVSIEGKKASILREDYKQISHGDLDEPVLRLLPGFDPYVLAHADKNHLVDSVYYKRVYRNQGWISPVVLLNGRVIGIWSSTRKGKRIALTVELFQRESRIIKSRIDEEAASLGRFLEMEVQVNHQGR